MNDQQTRFFSLRLNLNQVAQFTRRWLLPNPGTLVLMVILAAVIPAIADSARTPAASTSTISYQGYLLDEEGNPLTGVYDMEFRIYDAPVAGNLAWQEIWTGVNAVPVSDGLFNVMLGSINDTLASSIEGSGDRYLGITVGTDSEMSPRVQLGSVPFSMQALTVPDGAIQTDMIADGAVTQAKAPTLVESQSQFSRMEFGTGDWSGSWNSNPGGGTWYRVVNVTFAEPFTTAPVIMIAPTSPHPADWAKVNNIAATGFSAVQLGLADFGTDAMSFNWIAIGQ